MRASLVQSVVVVGLLAGCAGGYSIKPAEVLDERTGVTVGALQEPIELVEEARNAAPTYTAAPIYTAAPSNTAAPINGERRTSFAYLGPVEWDKSGDISYGLWVHIAPGSDRQFGDIRSSGALTLILDDGPLVLRPLNDANAVGGPYKPASSWGQTGYFALDVATLKRLSASNKLVLDFRYAGGSSMEFTPSHETRATLKKFMQARGITDD